MGATTDGIIKAVAGHNQSLEELSIYCSSKLSGKAVRLLAESCPGLRVLNLKCSEKVNDRSIEVVLRCCPSLTELSLFGCKKIKATAFRMFTSSASKKRPFQLRNLNLSYCELSKRGFKTLTKVCSDLQALHFSPLSTSFRITSADFIGLIQNCGNLTTLDLSNYHFEMDAILLEVSKTCSNLTTLLLDGIGECKSPLKRPFVFKSNWLIHIFVHRRHDRLWNTKRSSTLQQIVHSTFPVWGWSDRFLLGGHCSVLDESWIPDTRLLE